MVCRRSSYIFHEYNFGLDRIRVVIVVTVNFGRGYLCVFPSNLAHADHGLGRECDAAEGEVRHHLVWTQWRAGWVDVDLDHL